MAKVRARLTRSPITEAIVDFQTQPADGCDLASLQKLAAGLDPKYAIQGPIIDVQTSLSLSNAQDPQSETRSREVGVRLTTDDTKFVLQLRLDRFTLSRLEPYESWEQMNSEARRLWRRYCEALNPEVVTRVATRYINRLNLPLKHGETFQNYLPKAPDVPDELPQGVIDFLQRIEIFNPELEVRAVVIQLLESGAARAGAVPVILDIDVFKNAESKPDTENIWQLLEKMRTFKNEVFFASLTESAVELFA